MQLVLAGAHALGDRMGDGDDEVISAQIQRFDRARKNRQQRAKVPCRAGHALQERDVRMLALDSRAQVVGQEVDKRIEVGVRIHRQNFGERILAAAPGIEPVVDDGNAKLCGRAGNGHQTWEQRLE